MRKSTKRFLAILVSMLLCASLAVTIILACPWDPECPGPDDCHEYYNDDGLQLHHLGPYTVINERGDIEEGDPTYCPGRYYIMYHACDACGTEFTNEIIFPPEHDFVQHATDPNDETTYYWECASCGYRYE